MQRTKVQTLPFSILIATNRCICRWSENSFKNLSKMVQLLLYPRFWNLAIISGEKKYIYQNKNQWTIIINGCIGINQTSWMSSYLVSLYDFLFFISCIQTVYFLFCIVGSVQRWWINWNKHKAPMKPTVRKKNGSSEMKMNRKERNSEEREREKSGINPSNI